MDVSVSGFVRSRNHLERNLAFFLCSLNDSCALSADVGWPCIQPRMDHPEELLPELKKQLEPLEDARNQVEGIHAYVIKTLKERGCSNWHVLLGGFCGLCYMFVFVLTRCSFLRIKYCSVLFVLWWLVPAISRFVVASGF